MFKIRITGYSGYWTTYNFNDKCLLFHCFKNKRIFMRKPAYPTNASGLSGKNIICNPENREN